MSKMVAFDFNPDRDTLRQFGWIALVGFGFVAAIAWFEVLIFAFGLGTWRVPVAATFAGLGVLAAFFGLVYPPANRPIFVGLSLITFPIGFVLSYVLLGAFFFGMIAPVAIFFRLTGRDPMARGFDPDAESYWSDSRPARAGGRYFKQF
ncbi:MAG: SxtJ family membrane protein [Proteobacteria bacterium]|nr:SxtJ family membrane protein [Pseudomonadota bacterium]